MIRLPVLRLIVVAWWLHLKMMSRSVLQGLLMVMWPLFFATTVLLMYRVHGDPADFSYAALGAGVMALWSAVGTVASEVLQNERGSGTLELLVAAPTRFALAVFPITGAIATVGGYSMVATLVWARVVFGIDVVIARPVPFALAVAVTIAAVAALGFVLSVTMVRYRASWALGNVLEYPVWLVCGLLVPVSMFPEWVRPLSWALAPTWGVTAMRNAAGGGPVLPALACAAGLAVAYLALGAGLSGTVLRSARRHATLTLQ